MKTKKLLLAAAALMVLTACGSEDSPVEPTEERVPVRLGTVTVNATETRAAQHLNEGTLEKGERVMVRISNTGADSWTDYTYMTDDNGGMIAPDPCPYYPEGGQHIDIVAYLPATAGTSFTVAADQIADADFKASELLFASVNDQAKQDEPVELAFTHKMAKICANVTAGEGIGSIKGISVVNVRPTVSFNQATGEVGEATGETISIAMSNNGAAVIPEQTIDGTFLAVETDKGTANYDVNDVFFEAGYSYTANITVNRHALGTTTSITNWTKTGTLTVNPVMVVESATPAEVVAVDLGLSVKWANVNVGALEPYINGNYFAWGETSSKTYYAWKTYSFCKGSGTNIDKDCTNLTKYCPKDKQFNYWFDRYGKTDAADNKLTLDPSDDAARAAWGGNWRIPTIDEWKELMTECTWKWTIYSDMLRVPGHYVTGKNGNSIFLPACGYWKGKSIIQQPLTENSDDWKHDIKNYGYYWSSSLNSYNPSQAYFLYQYGSDRLFIIEHNFDRKVLFREYGLLVRPVKP